MTKERPIIFDGESVRAILAGRKTQTRRIVKTRSTPGGCRYGQPGDLLWVRETWCPVDDRELGGEEWIDYRATPRFEASHPAGWENAPDDEMALKWRSPMFMPRSAARLLLEVVTVRIERLQEISEEDAYAEGITQRTHGTEWGDEYAIEEFAERWQAINAKRGYPWDRNPEVWVVEFRRVEP